MKNKKKKLRKRKITADLGFLKLRRITLQAANCGSSTGKSGVGVGIRVLAMADISVGLQGSVLVFLRGDAQSDYSLYQMDRVVDEWMGWSDMNQSDII